MDPGSPFRALNNDLILDMIFKNLSTSNLLTCRLVNKKWNKIGSDTLKRRPVYVKIAPWPAEHFQELAQILSKGNFPATGLEIENGYLSLDLDHPAVKAFFNTHGAMFTRVYFAECRVKDASGMIKLLGDYLSNLEEITLKHFQIVGVKKDSSHLFMPKVRRINLENGHRVREFEMEQILRGAGSLKVINGLTSTDTTILEELVRQNKLGAIASFVLEDNPVELRSKVYQSLALQPPALAELTLTFPRRIVSPEFEQCVQALLMSSEKTLKKLVLERPKISWNDLPVVFTKLHTLELGNYDERNKMPSNEDGGIVSPGILEVNFAEMFPVLKRISLLIQRSCRWNRSHLLTGTPKILENHFWKRGTVLNTVDTLDLHDHFNPDGIKFLAQVFPNVTQVVINFSHASLVKMDATRRKPSDMWSVKEFHSLRRLVILDFPSGSDDLHLDNFLTGIPRNITKVLQKEPKHTFEAPCDRLMRPYGGLWMLRNIGLRELEIHCSEKSLRAKPPIMTEVAVWYGFEVIPGLRTTLKIPAKAKEVAKALNAFRPHVSVEFY